MPMLSTMLPPGLRRMRPSSPLNEVTPPVVGTWTWQTELAAKVAPELHRTSVVPGARLPDSAWVYVGLWSPLM